MDNPKQTPSEGIGFNKDKDGSSQGQSPKTDKKKWTNKVSSKSDGREVLLKVAGIEYKEPGKRQRLAIASIVLGGNLLLVIATLLYFYNPAFKAFITTVGK